MAFDFNGKTLLLGGGRTGVALHNLLESGEHDYTWIADTRLVKEPEAFLSGFSRVLTSPGIPADNLLLRLAAERGLPVYSELEVAYALLGSPIAAITGTNGKTTVTELAAHLVRASGRDTFCVGNVGVPVSTAVGQAKRASAVVCEVSSFMLEHVDTFRPHVAAITNVTPDHLDRHGGMEGYIAAKCRIYARMEEEDTLILNADDPVIRSFPPARARVRYFSLTRPADAWYSDGKLYLNGAPLLSAAQLKLKGMHNVANALAAALVAEGMGVSAERIAAALPTFAGVPHRIEYAGTDARGVAFYNDSKATNIASTLVAAHSFDTPIVLILGGSQKGYEFDALFAGLDAGSCRVVAAGETLPAIAAAAARRNFSIVRERDFDHAVRRAAELARPGETILLSPACASFDEFEDYRARGARFKRLAAELGAKL